METYSYEKCQSCVVRACCSKVCKDYRQYAYEKIALTIMPDSVSLASCEDLIARPPIQLKNKIITFSTHGNIKIITMEDNL